jgi:hypothetical protein
VSCTNELNDYGFGTHKWEWEWERKEQNNKKQKKAVVGEGGQEMEIPGNHEKILFKVSDCCT